MQRIITGFEQDQYGDWFAILDCGHTQHVRHKPPFQNRPWVLEDETRNRMIGETLPCPYCDERTS
jgi:hypothetical protein